MFNSIRTKLLILITTIVLVTVSLTTLIHGYLFHSHQMWSLTTITLTAGMSLSALLENLNEQKLKNDAKENLNNYCQRIKKIHPELATIGVIDAQGQKLFGEIPNGITELWQKNIDLNKIINAHQPQSFEIQIDNNSPIKLTLIPVNNTNYLVAVVLKNDAAINDLKILVIFSILTGLLVAIGSAFLGQWGMDLVVMRPLEKLLRAIREVTVRGARGERLDIGKTNELKILGDAFNDMLERLERSRLALLSNEKFLEAIVENIPILLSVQEARELRFVRFNRAGEAMLGLRRDELLGRTPYQIFPPEAANRYVARDQAILAAGVPVDVPEERIQTKSFGERIFYTQKIPIFDEQRRPLYLLGISEDITERRHVEEIRRFGAFQAGIAEMSVSVLHNIGNAITTVTDDAGQIRHSAEDLSKIAALLIADAERTTNLLETDKSSNELKNIAMRLLNVQREVARTIAQLQSDGLKEHAERIERNVCHIADIVRIQQSAALPGSGAAPFSLQRAIEDAMAIQGESLARHDEVNISLDIDTQVDEITTYRNRLLQALINILKNSYEAIRERQQFEQIEGQISITGRQVANGRVALHIMDNGIGIEPKRLHDIFRFGYSTKARGTGFGLHSVANFIQEQGGSIEVHSAGRNHGVELIIELPLRPLKN